MSYHKLYTKNFQKITPDNKIMQKMSVIMQLSAMAKGKQLIFFDECSFKVDCKPQYSW